MKKLDIINMYEGEFAGFKNIKYDELKSLPYSVEIGSRAFGVETEKSDFDIAILKEHIDWIDFIPTGFNIKNYFHVLPLGNNLFFKKLKADDGKIIDVIVFEHKEDLETLDIVVKELKKLPKYYIMNKSIRIELFETGLKYYGFKDIAKD